MTKQEIINTIRYEESQKYFEMLDIEEIYGRDSEKYSYCNAKWQVLYDLCKKLKIPT